MREGLKGKWKGTSGTELVEFGIYLDVGEERKQRLGCWCSCGWGAKKKEVDEDPASILQNPMNL